MALATSSLGKLLSLACALLLASALGVAQSTAPSTAKKKSTQKPAHKSAAKSTHKSTSASHSAHGSTLSSGNGHSKGKKGSKSKSKKKTTKGQLKIDSDRTRQIQEALIREHYLTGEPTGVWDASTQNAMQRFQAENGWQSKTTPDSRALIKLGLGPNHDHLLNPESAMTSAVPLPRNSNSSGPGPSLNANPVGVSGEPR